MTIHIDIDSTKLQAELADLARRATDLHAALDHVGKAVTTQTVLRFRGQHDPDGAPWEPLKQSTLARRKKKGVGAKILENNGHLRTSIHHEVRGNMVEIGTDIKYAAIHQFGGDIEHAARSQRAFFKVNERTGRSKFATKAKANFEQWVTRGASVTTIPARPYLGLNSADIEEIGQIIRKHLAK